VERKIIFQGYVMPKIKIELNSQMILEGELFDDEFFQKIERNFPLEFQMDRWGEELYGVFPIKIGNIEGDFQEVMDKGDVAYHPETGWFCIFWGKTPSSKGEEIRAALPVIKIGSFTGDWEKVSKLEPPVRAKIEIDK